MVSVFSTSILPTEDFLNFQADRISFKLHACREHLSILKDIESRYGDLTLNDIRMSAEMEIDDDNVL